MRRRSSRKVKFDSKIIVDVGLASLAVRVLPIIAQKFVPLDPTLYSVVGAGGTFLIGNWLKKPVMANAAIAQGLVELVTPFVDDLIGGLVGGSPMIPAISPSGIVKTLPVPIKTTALDDYVRLNDGSYIPYPTAGSSREYQFAY